VEAIARNNTYLAVEFVDRGGHVGFIEGRTPWSVSSTPSDARSSSEIRSWPCRDRRPRTRMETLRPATPSRPKLWLPCVHYSSSPRFS
jgi:hypothetical protein